MSKFHRSVPKHHAMAWAALKQRNGYRLEPWEKAWAAVSAQNQLWYEVMNMNNRKEQLYAEGI